MGRGARRRALAASVALGLTGALLTACSGSGSTSSSDTTSAGRSATTAAPPSSTLVTGSDPSSTGTSAGVGSTAPPAAAPQPGPPRDLVELRGDGLGVVTFGDGAEPTLAALTSIYGPPEVDSGYEAQAGRRVRRVSFGPLVVTLSGDPGAEVFTGWSYRPSTGQVSAPLQTAAGAASGLSFDELVARVGPTRPVQVSSVYEQCWTEATGEICASSSSRFAGATPKPDERVSALSASRP